MLQIDKVFIAAWKKFKAFYLDSEPLDVNSQGGNTKKISGELNACKHLASFLKEGLGSYGEYDVRNEYKSDDKQSRFDVVIYDKEKHRLSCIAEFKFVLPGDHPNYNWENGVLDDCVKLRDADQKKSADYYFMCFVDRVGIPPEKIERAGKEFPMITFLYFTA